MVNKLNESLRGHRFWVGIRCVQFLFQNPVFPRFGLRSGTGMKRGWFGHLVRSGMHVPHAPGMTWSRWEPGASGCLQCADGAVSVELCDDGAPRPFAIELRSNTEIVAQQFESLLFDLREDQRERLVDYGVEVVSYRAYRFFEVR